MNNTNFNNICLIMGYMLVMEYDINTVLENLGDIIIISQEVATYSRLIGNKIKSHSRMVDFEYKTIEEATEYIKPYVRVLVTTNE